MENIESRNSSINYEFNISDYKYKTKYSQLNISKVYIHKFNNFPFCYYDKNILKNMEETRQMESYNKTKNSSIFSFLLNQSYIIIF